ncbi:MAG: bifunctional tetrahydrofolate synthase/dihydrofolate synthase [Aliidiomarina sp.]|uniref:bifunctional tetrahydrofolate synthase/dihydrofolate synthase n=1 Tax=Aliidiomarina sp. TaxID=1872439 RepID=UPI0025C58786|nr:bifunctional tetrahydrofolate synthase/dihydrofolate synthase [Aliidiomarina sp.]MCH8501418.1 bifunctional tetrahydrofolate synthase/dihydrofolate synthase [Aliidiomarina sp.]
MNTSASEQATWDLSQWLVYLETIHNRPIDMGLDRVRQVANRLNLLALPSVNFVVAGTNGKGSTVRFLEKICLAAGRSVVAYTSPHIERYSERVRYNDDELPDSMHIKAFQAIEQGRGETSLTYFEYSTLAALWLVQQLQPDVVVLEVGLGGRLDAVNIVDADVAMVTSIGVDHVAFLGDNREDIGFEKAGVFRPHCPAVCGDPEPPQKLLTHAQTIASRLCCVGRDYRYERHQDTFDFIGPRATWTDLPVPQLPLINAATALAALQLSPLQVELSAIKQGLCDAELAGRLEVIQNKPIVIVDVGHNPHAAKYLAGELKLRFGDKSVKAVCAMLNDKDQQGTLAELLPVIQHWYLAPLSGIRGTTAEALAANLPLSAPSSCHESVAEALFAAVNQSNENDIILGFGSFLTVSAIKTALLKESKSGERITE